jgi:hypothetical protein
MGINTLMNVKGLLLFLISTWVKPQNLIQNQLRKHRQHNLGMGLTM